MTDRRSEISIVDVARHADVSVGTVSRVMNNHPGVRAELRRRVRKTVRRLGFVPKVPHRCLAVVTGRHSPTLPMGYVSMMSAMICRFAAANRYAVEIIEIDQLDAVLERHFDAVIAVVFDDRVSSLTQVPNLPVITLNHPMPDGRFHNIYTDHAAQGRIATDHLLEHGHRKIAMLAIEEDEWGSRERRTGYRNALQDAGVSFDESLVRSTVEEPVYEILSRWLHRDVTAILNFSEDTTFEVLHVLSNVLKLRIGQDISTITLEDLPVFRYLSPPQTSVCQPLEDLARLGVATALELATAVRTGESIRVVGDQCLPVQLVDRESVADLRPGAWPGETPVPPGPRDVHVQERRTVP